MEGTMMQFMGWMVIPFSIKCIFPNVQKWSSEWLDFILTLLSFCKQNFFFLQYIFFSSKLQKFHLFSEVIASSVAAEAIHGSETSKILKASIFYLLFLIFL